MESIIAKLEYFNFSKMEANIYVTLLKHRELNGSEISKVLGVSKSAVYDYLKTLEEKGVVLAIKGETKRYIAKNPEDLMNEIREITSENMESLKKELKKINEVDDGKGFWDFTGQKAFERKAKELINGAENEICMNNDFSLKIFEKELKEANKRGVRIIVFSFKENEKDYDFIEYYHNDKKYPCVGNRMMLVIDDKKTFVASNEDYDEIMGTYTENTLMRRIITEHIHHDIYLMKLDKNYEKDLIDKTILINSSYEKELVKRRSEENEKG